jgi:hypothetical protein
MKFKDDLSIASADRAIDKTEFKARPLNKKIFETTSKLPDISKKQSTTFDEFILSKSNAKLAKKTLVEYVTNKENTHQNTLFRARSVYKMVATPKTEYKKKLT